MANYFNHFEPIFDDTDKEMDAQLSVLYHDSHNGQIARCIFFQDHRDAYGNVRVEEACFTNPDNITFVNRENFFTDDRQDCYVSLATFANGARHRASDNLYNRSAMYIDIDCHNAMLSERARVEALQEAAGRLKDAYDNGILPIPTFINHTGRGLACFYVLERSINAKITETKNTLLAFQSIYTKLIRLYTHVLCGCEAEVDTCVSDAARIVRVAGTKNSKNEKTCHMIYLQQDEAGNVVYVPSLHYFDAYLSNDVCGFQTNSQYIHRHYTKEQSQVVLTRRLQSLTRLIELRRNDTQSLRHMTLFVLYQTTRALQDEWEAKETLYRSNFLYEAPLPEHELLNIITSTNRMITRKQSVYRFTNEHIINMLGISEDEARAIGFGRFGETKRQHDRRELKERHQKERRQRNARIYEMREGGMAYRAIAEQFDLTVRCVQMIVKQMQEAAVQVEKAGGSPALTGRKPSALRRRLDVIKHMKKSGSLYICADSSICHRGTHSLPAPLVPPLRSHHLPGSRWCIRGAPRGFPALWLPPAIAERNIYYI